MKRKYFIPNLEYFSAHVKSEGSIVPIAPNIVALDDQDDLAKLLDFIKSAEIIEDNQITTYVSQELPAMEKYLRRKPIDIAPLRDNIREIISDLPDSLFEEENIVGILRNIMNFVIRKTKIECVLINVQNGKFLYDENYSYQRIYSFLFNMIELNHTLPEYYNIFLGVQAALERIYLSNIEFANNELTKRELEMLRQIFNATGKRIVNFKAHLVRIEKEVNEQLIHIKRIHVKTPIGYEDEQAELLKLLNHMKNDLDRLLDNTRQRKMVIEAHIKEKGFTKKVIKLASELFRIREFLR